MTDVRLTATNPEDSSVVPVACNQKGELKLEEPIVVEGPKGEKGDQGEPGEKGDPGEPGEGGGSSFDGNLDGDLTVSGSGTFTSDVVINGVIVGLGSGSAATNTAVGVKALIANTTGDSNTAVGRSALWKNTEGSINIAVGRDALGSNTTGTTNTVIGGNALYTNTTGNSNTAVGRSAGYYIEGDNNTILGAYKGSTADATLSDTVIISAGPTERMRIDSDGIATFSGDVVVSSRGKQWMLVEQGGLCHMVQQLKATTADLVVPAAAAEYPKLRDVFAELNVVEKALEEVMEKLRMTEPDGWPVWDGSDNA